MICLWGPRTAAANWNDHPLGSELLGFRLLEPSAQQSWGIDPLEYRSPLVAPFVGFPDSGLLTTPIFRYWKIEPLKPETAAADSWQVDLAIDTGDPLVVRHRVGGGVVTSLSRHRKRVRATSIRGMPWRPGQVSFRCCSAWFKRPWIIA